MECLKNKSRSVRGFSLLEVVISMFVLSIGFLASINLATSSIRNSFFQRDEIIASELAQEGLELVYNIRDTNIANNKSDEFQGIPEFGLYIPKDYVSVNNSVFLEFEPCLFSISASPFGSSCTVGLNGNNFFVQGGTNGATKFFRRIDITLSNGNTNTRKITSLVVQKGGVVPFFQVNGDYTNSCINDEMHRCVFMQLQMEKE